MKKLTKICNFFGIQVHPRFNHDPSKCRQREFLMPAKEKILITLYETINKDNGMLPHDFVI
mgnify:CR=1 FL=1